MRIQSLFIFIVALCTLQFSTAQIPVLHNIISPSPNASAIAEYAEIPVDLHTGIPNISIPLYTIRSKTLSWPISLSYHSAGIKVTEMGGMVGLGWSIEGANSAVTRVMRGKPDEAMDSYFEHAANIPDKNDNIPLYLKDDLATGITDMLPDFFYYNTGKGNGRIIFDNNLIPRTVPRTDAKISVNGILEEFTITEPDGTIFQFNDFETTRVYVLGPDPDPFKSTWYLSRIISADKSDTIKFQYNSYSHNYVTHEQEMRKYYSAVPPGATKLNGQAEWISNTVDTQIPDTKILSSIEYNGGRIVFETSNRSDNGTKKLDKIIIYYRDPFTGNFVEKKRFNFSYGYFTNGSCLRLRLDNLQEEAAGQYLPPHEFTYSTLALPCINSFARDHWGYYNGAGGNDGLIPGDGNNRAVSGAYSKAGILSKIVSPLDGETEFIFEANEYQHYGNDLVGPGLRIQKIIRKDPFSNIEAITNYDYKRPSDGKSSGRLVDEPIYDSFLEVRDQVGSNTYNYYCHLEYANPSGIGNFPGSPVVYHYVTTYNGNSTSVSGKTIFKFSVYDAVFSGYPYVPATDNSWVAGRLLYKEDYKVSGSNETLVSKVVNDYEFSSSEVLIKGLKAAYGTVLINAASTANDFVLENFITEVRFQYLSESTTYIYEEDSGTIASVLTRTYHHDTELDHTFPVKIVTQTSDTGVTLQEEISYPADYSTGVLAEMKALNMIAIPIERKTFSIQGSNEYLVNYSKSEFLDWGNQDIYPKYSYRPKVAISVLRSTFNSNPSAYLQKALTVVKYSDVGLPIEAKPEDGQSNAALIDTYHQSAIASCSPAAVDQIAYTGFETPYRGQWTVNQGSSQQTGNVSLTLSTPSSAFEIHANQTINYSYSVTRTAGPGPTVTFSKIGAGPITHTLSLTSGSGNAALTSGVWTATIDWGFNVSAMSVSFSYQYTYWNPLNISSTAKTGLQSLSLQTGNTISKTGLPAGDYVVSYYQKNGTVSFSVSGSASVLSTEANAAETDGWSLIRKTVRIINTTDAIQLTCTSCLVDELRLQPIESFMTTQSYDRQGRLVTQTDQNIRSQYIEYDVWDRVIITRDNERNIQQHYEYKFANN